MMRFLPPGASSRRVEFFSKFFFSKIQLSRESVDAEAFMQGVSLDDGLYLQSPRMKL